MKNDRLSIALLCLRLSVFLVMIMWIIAKFIKPEMAVNIAKGFYNISGFENYVFIIIGAVQLLVLIGFVVGYQKRFTYGAIFLMHAASTFSSYKQYLDPFTSPNLLFFAAWPMLAACFALYYLREHDVLAVFDNKTL